MKKTYRFEYWVASAAPIQEGTPPTGHFTIESINQTIKDAVAAGVDMALTRMGVDSVDNLTTADYRKIGKVVITEI